MEPNPTPTDRPLLPPPLLERSLEAFFAERVRRSGGMALKLIPTRKGMPDRLVVLPDGVVCFVELKTDTGVPSPAQRVMHERLTALGADVSVLSGKGEILAWLRSRVGSRRSRKA